jgi:hypothetical protein
MQTQYERYYTPREPKDPNAEYLDAQETAWVFKTGVRTIQRRAKELGLGSRVGNRKMFSRADREAMYEGRREGTPARIPAQRRRKTVKRSAVKPAAPTRSTTPIAA